MAGQSHILKLNGAPLLIYMRGNDTLRSKYVPIIEAYGGISVTTAPTPENGILFLSSDEYDEYSPVYQTKLIDDSILNGHLMPLSDYEWGAQAEPVEQQDNENVYVRSKKLSKYTPEQDEFILEQIRLHPIEKGSHKFFEKLATAPELKDHSNHSIRSRFRKHLIDRLQYCYKVDERGNLVLDSNGEKIKVSVDDLPERKRKFTAADDYLLCLNVVTYAKENLPDTKSAISDSPSVPVSFFKDVMRRFPNHTDQSWRDRYRKFAVKYGIKKYIQYYEDCRSKGIEAKPMKDFTSGSYTDKRNGVGKLVGSNFNDEQVNVPLDEEISQVKNSNIDAALENQKVGSAPQPSRPVLQSLEDEEDEDEVEDEDEDDINASQVTFDTAPQAPSQTLAPKKSSPVIPATPSPGKPAIDPHTYALQVAASRIATPPAKKRKKGSHSDDVSDLVDKLQYLQPGATIHDVFDNEFYKFDNGVFNHKFSKLHKKLQGRGIHAMYKGLRDLHFTDKLAGHIIRSTGGNLQSFKQYSEIFLSRMEVGPHALNDPLTLSTVKGISGIWTQEYEDSLRREYYLGTKSPDLDFQSEKDKQARIEFLKNIGEFDFEGFS